MVLAYHCYPIVEMVGIQIQSQTAMHQATSIRFIPYYIGTSANQQWQCVCNICGSSVVQPTKSLCIQNLKCLKPDYQALTKPEPTTIIPRPDMTTLSKIRYQVAFTVYRFLAISCYLIHSLNLTLSLWCNDYRKWIEKH